ncbi:hypothetical protein [Sphingobium yanoikuyae]|uniref:hypothetical protein n=1 Tax=Sphingobium yanoikuyae TaxID=13690 RepID=UPI0026F19CF1|nr:hypothetical protein [Sphingobium yanoikuyae]
MGMPKQIEYVVRGHWPFPLDMLRHDCSVPASADDRSAIDNLSQEYAPDRAAFSDVDIRLVGPQKPNTGRWESFGWKVPSDTEHAFIKSLMQQKARDDALFAGAMAKLTEAERRAVSHRLNSRFV